MTVSREVAERLKKAGVEFEGVEMGYALLHGRVVVVYANMNMSKKELLAPAPMLHDLLMTEEAKELEIGLDVLVSGWFRVEDADSGNIEHLENFQQALDHIGNLIAEQKERKGK